MGKTLGGSEDLWSSKGLIYIQSGGGVVMYIQHANFSLIQSNLRYV